MSLSTSSLLHKDQVFLFDFDGTIFNTTQLKIDISEELKDYTQDTDLIWRTEKKLHDRRFHLVETMYQFCQSIGREDIHHIIQHIFLNKKFEIYLYPDFIQSIKQLRQNAITALFTQGDESYQQVKIYQSKASQYFDFIYIYQQKLSHLQEIVDFFQNKQIWLFDNQLSMLEHAKMKTPQIKTIWVNRDQIATQTNFTPDKTISSLLEFVV